MNTIPTTSRTVRSPYTVIGGTKFAAGGSDLPDVSVLLLNRGVSGPFKGGILEQLLEHDFREVLSIETGAVNYDIEALSQRIPRVRFIMLQTNATPGEMINIGMREAKTSLVLVMWSDMELITTTISYRMSDKIIENNLLCSVPHIANTGGEDIPSIMAPAFHRNKLKIVPLFPENEDMPTIFPFDYAGMYLKKNFITTGGYDHSMDNPYWQKLDFGFRSFMWGEKIVLQNALKIKYRTEMPPENTNPDSSYTRFYLKNLAPRYNGNAAVIPLKEFFTYKSQSGVGFFTALRGFRAVKKWLRLNSLRFTRDARSVTELWEDEIE